MRELDVVICRLSTFMAVYSFLLLFLLLFMENPRCSDSLWRKCGSNDVPSSSRTLSPIVTEVSWFEYCSTMILVNSMPNLILSQH